MTTEGDIWKILLKELCLQAYAKGYKQGYHQAMQKPIRNLITRSSFTDEQIAVFQDVTVNYVAEIRKSLTAE